MEGQHYVGVTENNSVSLVCGKNLQSNPDVNIRWINPKGDSVHMMGNDDGDNYSQINGPEVVQLNIANISKTDSGAWTCEIALNVSIYNCTSGEYANSSLISTVNITLDVFCKCYNVLILLAC